MVRSEKLDDEGSNSCQANSSSSSGIPLQGLDNNTQPENLHQNVASQSQLVLPRATLTREHNNSAHGGDSRTRVWLGRSPILLPRTGAEVSTTLPPLQMVSTQPRVRPEYTNVQRQSTVIIPRDNRQVDVGLSLNTPGQRSRNGDLTSPIIISSGYSTYILEDNEEGEGSSSSGSKRVSCKKRAMDGIAPSGWLALGKNSGAITPAGAMNIGSSRNIRQRSIESNMEHHLQLLQENHHKGFAPFSSQIRANMHIPYSHFVAQMPRQVNVSPLANPSSNLRPGVTSRSVGRIFDDHFQRLDDGLHFHWLLDSNSTRNHVFQLPQGNPRNQLVRHNNQSSALDHNNLLMPRSSSSSPGVASREPRGPGLDNKVVSRSNQAPVSTQRSVGIVIKEVGSSSASSSSSGGAGGDNPKASSSSTDVVPAQQRRGKEVLNVIPEESSDDEEFIYEEFDEDESSEDESEDLDFDAEDISFEDFMELEEEKGGNTSGLSADEIEKLIKRTKYASPEVSSPQKQEPCPICWEDYVDGDDIGKMQCEHDYHLHCLKKWLEIKNNCPLCEKTTLIDE